MSDKLKKEFTVRGFGLYKFEDGNGVGCSLQMSSAAEEPHIWLGCDEADPKVFVPYGDPSWQPIPMPEEYIANTRMHLTQEEVKLLLPILKRFVKEGEI